MRNEEKKEALKQIIGKMEVELMMLKLQKKYLDQLPEGEEAPKDQVQTMEKQIENNERYIRFLKIAHETKGYED